MNIKFLKIYLSLVILLFLYSFSYANNKIPLICHIGGTMRPVIQELAKLYTEKTGISIEINAAGSGELLAQIELQQRGDIYVCHDPFMDILMRKKLGQECWIIAELTPVIIIKKGNPKNIKGIRDLKRQDITLILTDYKLSTLGRMLKNIFAKSDIDFEQLKRHKKIITNKSGSYAANYVVMGNADASIVWNAVYELRKKSLDAISIKQVLPIPNVDAITSATKKIYKLTPVKVIISTLKCSKQPEKAKSFAKFIASKQARKVFLKYGFTMNNSNIPRQAYKNTKPISLIKEVKQLNKKATLRIYVGAGLRPAMEQLISKFTLTTGVKVEPDYGGSGMILTRARMDKTADLFIPGDVWYIEQLQKKSKLIAKKTQIAYFVPVIITQQGNPKKISGLKDFIRQDIKVALGQPATCQIGKLSQKIFRKNNINYDKIKNPLYALTVNELGVWVKMGNADTAIVWGAIARNIAKDIDIINIPLKQNIISRVVIGQLTTSKNILAAKAFVEFVTSPKGVKILKDKGFNTELPYQK